LARPRRTAALTLDFPPASAPIRRHRRHRGDPHCQRSPNRPDRQHYGHRAHRAAAANPLPSRPGVARLRARL